MPIDPAEFAKECVSQGLNCGINPHYLLGVASLRSGISEGSQNAQIGPFRLIQAQWDANRTNDEFAFNFLPEDINEWDMQCAVFALMAHRSFDAFALANNHDPSALELYLQQWPAAQSGTLSADLQTALNATAALVEPAAAAIPDAAPSVPPRITNPGQPAPRAVMGPLLQKLSDANRQRSQNMQVNANLISKLDKVARRLIAPAAKQRYQAISATTQVPWFIIAVIHEREASQSFAANIAQGNPWNRVSTDVPAGRGPFNSFEEAAIDALTKCAPFAARWRDWTFGGAVTLLEQYNGLGYARRGLPSPYIWASTNQYVRGKFVADHRFDPNVVDQQLGCAALLAQMRLADPTIVF
jgi:lysozyme family protein